MTRTRLARAAASIALASAVLLGTAGCVFMNPIATLEEYDPSDGINNSVGAVDLRNVILFVDEETGAGSLMVTLVNNSADDATVSFQFLSEGDEVTVAQKVPGRTVVELGTSADGTQLLILGVDTSAGALYPVYVQSGSNPGVQLLVPVLTATGDYEGLGPVIPEPEPTPTPTPTPAATEEPAPTEG